MMSKLNISLSIDYTDLFLDVFDRFSHCLHEMKVIFFTNMAYLVRIYSIYTENI